MRVILNRDTDIVGQICCDMLAAEKFPRHTYLIYLYFKNRNGEPSLGAAQGGALPQQQTLRCSNGLLHNIL